MGTRLIFVLLAAGTLQAGELELQPDTVKAWNEYVQKATTALQDRIHSKGPFLWADGHKDREARLKAGEIVVVPVGDSSPKHVPSGLIHDWMGAAFLPNVRIDDVMSVVRDYPKYKEVYRPGVLDAKLLKQTQTEDRFSLLLRNPSFFSKTAVDSDYNSSYVQLDEKRWYTVSCSTRVQEIENYSQPGEKKLPPDRGHGYMWRMCSLSRLEERDGGVFVDEEMMALSREVPTAIRWMAGPVIRRVAKETLASSIGRTRAAVGEKAGETRVAMKVPAGVDSTVCRSATVGCLR
jgi:hypothetical protein